MSTTVELWKAQERIAELEDEVAAWKDGYVKRGRGNTELIARAQERIAELEARLRAADWLAEAVSDWFDGRPDGDDLLEVVNAYREAGQ